MSNNREAREKLWRKGCLAYKLRPNGQTEAYWFIKHWKDRHPNSGGPLVINAHRRFGKSFLSILLGLERAISKKKQKVRTIAPTKVQNIGIFQEQWNELIHDKPDFIEIKQTKEYLQIFNHLWKDASPAYDYSELYIHGSEAGGGERLRGRGSNMLILDEPRDMTDMEYFLKNVIGWHLMKQDQPLLVIISTPPRSADHYLISKIIPEAREYKRYFEMPISRDLDVSEEDYQFILELCGSKESIAWQREGECQLLADPGNLILYEWTRHENSCRVQGIPNDYIFSEYKRPEYYFPRVTIDAGYGDPNGAVFWFYDFKKEKIVILDELFTVGQNSEDLKNAVIAKEKEVFKDAALISELRRDSDMNPQQREDMRAFFNFQIDRADNHDKDAAIDATNASIAAGKILISNKCTNLLFQLRNACYKREGSSQFMRSKQMGHCDMVAALITAHRDLPFISNWDPSPVSGTYVGELFIPEEEEGVLAVLDEKEYRF